MFDNRDKQLCLEGKTTFLHSSNVALKLRNILNLSTADFQIHGSLTKVSNIDGYVYLCTHP